MKLLILLVSISKSEKCLYNPHEALCSSPGHRLCNRANQPIFVGNGNSTLTGVTETFCDETFFDYFGHVSELQLYCQQLGGMVLRRLTLSLTVSLTSKSWSTNFERYKSQVSVWKFFSWRDLARWGVRYANYHQHEQYQFARFLDWGSVGDSWHASNVCRWSPVASLWWKTRTEFAYWYTVRLHLKEYFFTLKVTWIERRKQKPWKLQSQVLVGKCSCRIGKYWNNIRIVWPWPTVRLRDEKIMIDMILYRISAINFSRYIFFWLSLATLTLAVTLFITLLYSNWLFVLSIQFTRSYTWTEHDKSG